MIKLLQKWATGRNVLILLAADLIFMMGIMPYMGKKMEALAPGIPPLDITIPSYSAAYAQDIITKMTDPARAFYKSIELGADMIYPLVYGFAFALLIAFLWKQLGWQNGLLKWVILFPLIGMIFDYGENFSVVSLINQHPNPSAGTAQIAAYFSLSKWSFAFSSVAAVLIGLLAWGWKARSSK
ncbi:MAG: hypothetical protein HRU41_33250 [Saprospiraceae bacterium]|nr:hypothetical protein [Saprospiraceae bacterium]